MRSYMKKMPPIHKTTGESAPLYLKSSTLFSRGTDDDEAQAQTKKEAFIKRLTDMVKNGKACKIIVMKGLLCDIEEIELEEERDLPSWLLAMFQKRTRERKKRLTH